MGLFAVVLAALLAGTAPAWAHDATDGSTVVEIDDRRVLITTSVPFAELGYVDTSDDGLIDADELAAQESTVAPTLVAASRGQVALTVDGEAADLIGAGVPSPSEFGGNDRGASTHVMLVLASGPHDGDVVDVALDWGFPVATRAVVVAHPHGTVTGELGEDRTLAVSLDTWSSARSYLALGIDHIRFGPDHLLFLLVLTVAVAGTSITRSTTWRTVKLVTWFTLGHAVSLGLAYVDLVAVPAWIVEPAISLSIVAAAVLAIRGRDAEARPWIAALVGVVHGLGFASSLGSLGVVTSQRAVALAAFNLGIDAAQTLVVLGVMGGLWLGAQVLASRMVWVRTAIASGAGLMGVAWTASRLAELPL